jgi:hypothetical protein
MRYLISVRVSCLLLLALTVCAVVPTSSRPLPKPGRWRVAQDGDFVSLLGQIARAHQVGFIIEASPLRSKTDDAELMRLVADPDAAVSVKVATVATHFDYRVVSKPGAFLLVKRHSHPLDFPDVSYAELCASLDDFVAVLDAIMPPVDPALSRGQPDRNYIARRLFDSLTPEQRERMKDRSQVVRVRDMTPVQREMARQLVLGGEFSDLRVRARALRAFLEFDADGSVKPVNDVADRFGLAVTRRDFQGQPVSVFTPFMKPTTARIARNSFETECQRYIEQYDEAGDRPTETLGALAIRLNQSPAGGKNKKTTFAVDDALREKRILFVGAEGLDPLLRFIWAATVYDLHVTAPGPAVRRIVRPPLQKTDDPTQVYARLRATLPAPLLRFYFYSEGISDINPANRDFDSPRGPDHRERSRAIATCAATLLDMRLTKAWKESPNSFPLAVSTLKPRENSWLVNYSIGIRDFLPNYAAQRKQLPTKVTGINDLAIVISQNEWTDYVGFVRFNPNGSLGTVAMSFTMDRPKDRSYGDVP